MPCVFIGYSGMLLSCNVYRIQLVRSGVYKTLFDLSFKSFAGFTWNE